MANTRVDIIIPAYNAHKTIHNSLDSICREDYNDISVYIIDDCSDESYDYLIDEYKELDLNIHRLDKRSGPGEARNVGINLSNGSYLFFLDADDELVSPTIISKLVVGLSNNDVAVGIVSIEREDGSIISYTDDEYNVHGKLYSREYIDSYNIRFPKTTRHEDRVFHQLVLTSNPRKIRIDDVAYFYRFNRNSLTKKDGLLEEAKSIEDLFIGIDYYIDNCFSNNFSIELIEVYLLNAIIYAFSLYNSFYGEKVSKDIKKWSKRAIDIYKKYEDCLRNDTKSGIYNFLVPSDLEIKVSLEDFLDKPRMNILISFNDSYLEQAIIMLKSLRLNTYCNIKVYLIYNDINEQNLAVFKEVMNEIGELELIEFNDKIKLPINIDHITKETYFRLFAPYLLPKMDRVLYLDCDLIITNSIDGFYNTDLGDNVIAGVTNFDGNSYLYNERLGLPKDNTYINAGVLLIDINNYKKCISKKDICKYIEDNFEILDYQDQDVINYLFYKKIELVDIKYNYQITQIIPGYEEFDNSIVHYCNKYKPWNDDFIYYNKATDYYNLLDRLGMEFRREELELIHHINYEKNKYNALDYNCVLSIIVPVYNSSKYLERCIDSIINQDLKSIEVLLINDGSTDDSLDICNEYSRKDKRIKVIDSEHKGVSEIRNIGVRNAAGKYITFVDSDDYVKESIYVKALDYMLDNDLKMTVYNFNIEYDNGYIDDRSFYNNNLIIDGNDMYIEILKDDRIMNFVWSKIIDSSILKSLEFPKNMVYEDLCISIPMIEKLERFGYLGEGLYNYCRRPGSITTTYSYQSIKDGIDLNYKQYSYLNEKYPDLEVYNLYNLIKRVVTLYFDNYNYIDKNSFFKDYSNIINEILDKYNNYNNEVLSIFDDRLMFLKDDMIENK